MRALQLLADSYLARGEYPAAIESLRRLAALEPWQEDVQRKLVESLARSGEAPAALAAFEAYREILARELQTQPGTAITELYEHVRAGRSSSASATTRADQPASTAVRRQVTALACEVVGASELASRLDPEVLQPLLRAWDLTFARAIERWHGQRMPSPVGIWLTLFGYPHAEADAAACAVRAAREIVSIVPTGVGRSAGPLRLRAAIDTSLVLVDVDNTAGASEPQVVGRAPLRARRLVELAEPGAVVVSRATQQVVSQMFEWRPLGPRLVEHGGPPVQVFAVTADTPRPSTRREPLIGRAAERRELFDAWRHATSGRGQLVVIRGDPGIGKSRLVAELEHAVGGGAQAADQRQVQVGRCSPSTQLSPLRSIAELVEQRADAFNLSGAPRQALDELLGAPVDMRHPAPAGPGSDLEGLIEALVDVLVARPSTSPRLLVLEDVQWADPSTLELLRRVAARAASARLLVILTCRTPFQLPWPSAECHELHLGSLEDEHIALLVRRTIGEQDVPPTRVADIVARSDGVPFFAEELARAAFSDVDDPTGPASIPITLRDALEARFARLGGEECTAASPKPS